MDGHFLSKLIFPIALIFSGAFVIGKGSAMPATAGTEMRTHITIPANAGKYDDSSTRNDSAAASRQCYRCLGEGKCANGGQVSQCEAEEPFCVTLYGGRPTWHIMQDPPPTKPTGNGEERISFKGCRRSGGLPSTGVNEEKGRSSLSPMEVPVFADSRGGFFNSSFLSSWIKSSSLVPNTASNRQSEGQNINCYVVMQKYVSCICDWNLCNFENSGGSKIVMGIMALLLHQSISACFILVN